MAGSTTSELRKFAGEHCGRSNRSSGRTAAPLFALESFEQRLFFSVDPTTQKVLDAFESVYNTIEYQPYAGVMKGAISTEQTKAGNAWDQDLLLIKRLEALDLGIEAVLRFGTVEAPSDLVKRWLAVKDETAAEKVLYASHLHRQLDANNDGKVDLYPTTDSGSIQFLHTWVHASIPGIGEVDLDPS